MPQLLEICNETRTEIAVSIKLSRAREQAVRPKIALYRRLAGRERD
jgi:hypothetical protein